MNSFLAQFRCPLQQSLVASVVLSRQLPHGSVQRHIIVCHEDMLHHILAIPLGVCGVNKWRSHINPNRRVDDQVALSCFLCLWLAVCVQWKSLPIAQYMAAFLVPFPIEIPAK